MSVHIDISIRADTPDQLADAFAFILERGIPLTPGGGVLSEGDTPDEIRNSNLISFRARGRGGASA